MATYIGTYLMSICLSAGMKHGLGVENLAGSGMIAGETSQAYQDTFTISLVCDNIY